MSGDGVEPRHFQRLDFMRVFPAHVAQLQFPAIMRQDGYLADRLFVARVDKHRRGGCARFPHFAPLAQREHGRKQGGPLFRKAVFDLAAVIGHRFARQNAVIDQTAESVGENVARNAQRRLEFFKMVQAVKGRSQNQERPALSHRLQRRGQAALYAEVFLQLTHLIFRPLIPSYNPQAT